MSTTRLTVFQADGTPAARGGGGGASAGAVGGVSAGAASGGRGAAGAAAGGDDEPAAWAVDTDDEDEDGAMGWEEVELPERNEDIDPEVGGARSVQCPSAVGAPWLGAFVRFDEFLVVCACIDGYC